MLLHQILEGEKQYVIPHFQRFYRWGEREWGQLWDDIGDLYDGEGLSKDHFMGTLVCTPWNHTPAAVPMYVVIDGQQRLVTFTILLCSLRDLALQHAMTGLASEIEKKYLLDEFKKGAERFKVIPRTKDREFLLNLIEAKPRHGDNRILDAYDFFTNEVGRKLKAGEEAEYRKLYNAITKQLSLVVITVDAENPFAIFESLNAKGLPLAESDLIRNYVFMTIPLDQQDEFDHDLWAPLERLIGLEDTGGVLDPTEFYRAYLMRKGEYIRKGETYLRFKKTMDKDSRPTSELVAELTTYAGYYRTVYGVSTGTEPSISEALSRLKRMDIATANPLVLSLLERLSTGRLSREDFVECIKSLESFALRRSICGESTRGYGRLFTSAINAVGSDIRGSLKAFLLERGWPEDDRFRMSLKEFELYRREFGKCGLVLEMLERSYKHKEPVDMTVLTIEHVMPQTMSDIWKSDLGQDWERVFKTWLHTLGNLTLTGYNTELWNDPFPAKKTLLLESHLELNKYFTELEKWGEGEIKRRADLLADQVIEIWPRG